MVRDHLGVKAAEGLEGRAMLLMIEKPRPTPAERGFHALRRAFFAVSAVLDRIVMGPFRALDDRRLLDVLAAMSDRDLADIGLGRGEVRNAAAIPMGSDGTLFVAARRGRR